MLDPGWLEGMTLNTLEPSPVGEANRDGRIALELGRIPAGTTHRFLVVAKQDDAKPMVYRALFKAL